jgi:cellulose synthase/poly-beta-1,6-N-acetylglucosamine synthase-like glycosyltransferase
LVAIFDCDHVPHADFLAKTVPYFADASVAFVQTPQYYKNFSYELPHARRVGAAGALLWSDL